MIAAVSRLRDAFRTAPGAVRGLSFMLLSTLILAVMQVCVRVVAADLHVFQIVFLRLFFGLLAFLPLFVRDGLAPLRTKRIHLHALRAVFSLTAMTSYFLALSLSPLAMVVALDFSGPLFATVLAVLFLGEKVHAPRIAALAAGFVGTLVIVRPGFAEIELGALIALGSAVAWGGAIITIKIASRTESSATITIYVMVFGLPIALLVAIPTWQTLEWSHLLWLAAIGALGSGGNWCYTQAFREADLTLVLPFDFLRLIWVAGLGYAFFAEVPGIATWAGAVMIFAAAFYLAYRESRAREGRARAPMA